MIMKADVYCLKNESRINELILITNGTILMDDELINLLASGSNTKVIINQYGSLSRYAEENHNRCSAARINNVLYTDDNRYSWADCRDHSLKHTTDHDIEQQACSCVFFTKKKFVVFRRKTIYMWAIGISF